MDLFLGPPCPVLREVCCGFKNGSKIIYVRSLILISVCLEFVCVCVILFRGELCGVIVDI